MRGYPASNAGISHHATLLDTMAEEWQRVLCTNVDSVFWCSREAIAVMVQQRSGIVVNITSVIGLIGGRARAAYCASKGAVVAMTRNLALDHAGPRHPGQLRLPEYRRYIARRAFPRGVGGRRRGAAAYGRRAAVRPHCGA